MIVSTAHAEYQNPYPQMLSIAKRAMEDARPHLKQMRIMQVHIRAIQPYLNAFRQIPLRKVHNHIQHLNSILPSLNFLRFVEKAEALNRAQGKIRFYREILSNANYRKEEIFRSRVENSPPTTLDSHVTSSKVTKSVSLGILKSKSNGPILKYSSCKRESRFSAIPDDVRKYIEDYKILKWEGYSKKQIFFKLLLKAFLEKLLNFIS